MRYVEEYCSILVRSRPLNRCQMCPALSCSPSFSRPSHTREFMKFCLRPYRRCPGSSVNSNDRTFGVLINPPCVHGDDIRNECTFFQLRHLYGDTFFFYLSPAIVFPIFENIIEIIFLSVINCYY